jgi:C4-dicarboxylate-binding protein DctP
MRLGAGLAAVLVAVFAIVAVRFVMVRAAQAEQPDVITIRFSHVATKDTPKGKAAIRFKELAEAKTGGRVHVEVYPNSSLYKDKEELEALQLGAVQMLAPGLAKFSPLGVKSFEVFDLPFLFPDQAAIRAVTTGPVGHQLLAALEPHGFKGLAYWDNGFKVFTANTPLRNPDDFKGLKFRIQSSKVLDEQMRALKAIPQVMAFSESYQALQTGVVDGTENTPSNIYTQKMHEVQKYLVAADHGYVGYAVIVNKRFWEGLPPDIRSELDEAMAEATTYANTIAYDENVQALEAIRKAGTTEIITLTPAQLAAWRAALAPVQQTMAARIGPPLLQAVNTQLQGLSSHAVRVAAR